MADLFSDSSGILLNRLGIKDSSALAKAEANIGWVNVEDLNNKGGIPGGKFDKDHFQKIHKFIFGDIYPWAGETRADRQFQGHKPTYSTGNKEVMIFAPYTDIDKNLKSLAKQLENENYLKGLPLDRFIDRSAFYLDQFNYTHTFREGNGRTLQCAFTQLGQEAGYRIDFKNLNNKEDYNLARDLGMIRKYGFPNTQENLEELKSMLRAVTSPMQTKEAAHIRHTPAVPTPKLTEDILTMEVKREFDVTGIRLMEMLPAFQGMEIMETFLKRLEAVRFNITELYPHKETFNQLIKTVVNHPQIRPGSQDYKDAKRFEQSVLQLEKTIKGQKIREDLMQKPHGPRLR